MYGKYSLARSILTGNDTDYRAYLKTTFERHIFSPKDLSHAVKQVVDDYQRRLDDIDAEVAIELEADLDLPKGKLTTGFRHDDEFRKRCEQLIGEASSAAFRDLGADVARELISIVVGELATIAAARAAVSAGLISGGVTLSPETFGIGLVVAYILDQMIDQAMKFLGYDPIESMTQEVTLNLVTIKRTLVEGDPKSSSPDGKQATVGRIGLRRWLQEMNRAQAAARRELLKELTGIEGT